LKNNTETAARRPRILLNGSYAPSLTNFRGDFIRAMIARGFDVHVSAPDIPAEIRAEVEAYGASVHQSCVDRAGMNIRNDVRYLLEMRRLVKSIQPDIVVGYTIKPNIWGGLAARLAGTASISMVTGLGYAFGESGNNLRGRVIGTLSRRLYRLATSGNKAVIFQNPDDRDDFIAAGCLSDTAKVRMTNGSGVNVTQFTPTPLADQPIFLLIGRLLKAKGVREYAEAGLRLLGERADCRVQIAGFIDDGPDSITPEELDVWIKGGIEFLGSLDDVRPALAAATVYVLPSYREGTPRTVLEAMASARAVITTDAPGCRETVKNGETGLLVQPRDADALYKAMVQLADDPKLRAKFGAEGRKYCEEKYDVAKVNDTLIGHLELL
jgi:glycosyltransferase involved in cell wall biosynthesis